MAGYYEYLVSSLPMLHFGAKPPFSYEKFLEMCSGLISERDMDILKEAPLAKWKEFDIALRNELVKIRASRKHVDPVKYLRKDGYADPSISHIALNAHRAKSIIEAEKTLDRERWNFLDEITIGHYFDIDFLITYSLKLIIMERWARVKAGDKVRLLDEVLVAS